MDTAPLLWGLIGLGVPAGNTAKPKLAFWPSFLIGLDDMSVAPPTFVAKVQAQLGGLQEIEDLMKQGPGGYKGPPTTPIIVSHGSLAFSPLKEAALKFEGLKLADHEVYPLWILTATALADGNVERSRKLIRFLLEPKNNLALVQASRVGATTLREQDGLETLPESLQASYFRKFPIDKILIERDERVRLADEVLEQAALGASIKVAKPVETPKPKMAPPGAPGSDEAPAVAATPRPKPVAKPKPTPPPEDVHEEESDVVEGAAPAAAGDVTAPSESQPHDD